jgi:sarcosine oxidase subunit beta
MVGLEFPGKLCKSQLVITEQVPPMLGPFAGGGGHGYFFQAESGNVVIGVASQPVSDYSQKNRVTTHEALTLSPKRAATMLPRLAGVAIIRTSTGFTMWTPDLLPLVGAVDGLEGFIVVAEFNGTGFAVGPVYGELVAELILEGRTSLPIEPFSPNRFNLDQKGDDRTSPLTDSFKLSTHKK